MREVEKGENFADFLFGLMSVGGEGHAGCGNQLISFRRENRADEDAVGCASDEIANALVAGKQGHGVAIGSAGVESSEDLVYVGLFGAFERGLEGAPIGSGAMLE